MVSTAAHDAWPTHNVSHAALILHLGVPDGDGLLLLRGLRLSGVVRQKREV